MVDDLPEEPEPLEAIERVSEAPPSNEFDGEDFLFHLYRGSELLQDNCVTEAKEELESALRMQPRDVEGQGLLGVVYFRLGNYDRAIHIYEELVRMAPTDVTPKINLALCYLKTGQFPEARLRLEEIINLVPDHTRAWGYLGLVFQRLGQYAKAQAAFERANQARLAARMARLLDDADADAETGDSYAPERDEMRAAAADAVQELEDTEDDSVFSLADGDDETAPASRSGRWRAIELGQAPLPSAPRVMRGVAMSDRLGRAAVPTPSVAPWVEAAPTARELAERTRVLFPNAERVAIRSDGVVLARVEERFSVRVDRVRAMVSEAQAFRTATLRRHLRGQDVDEALGGISSPIVSLEGVGNLVLAPEDGRNMHAMTLEDEFVYVREAYVVGFEPTVSYENGRFSVGEGEFVPMLQFSGEGAVVVESRGPISAADVPTDSPAVFRGDDVLGWTGRLFPRPLPHAEAPGGLRGFVAFSGSGSVFLHGTS